MPQKLHHVADLGFSDIRDAVEELHFTSCLSSAVRDEVQAQFREGVDFSIEHGFLAESRGKARVKRLLASVFEEILGADGIEVPAVERVAADEELVFEVRELSEHLLLHRDRQLLGNHRKLGRSGHRDHGVGDVGVLLEGVIHDLEDLLLLTRGIVGGEELHVTLARDGDGAPEGPACRRGESHLFADFLPVHEARGRLAGEVVVHGLHEPEEVRVEEVLELDRLVLEGVNAMH